MLFMLRRPKGPVCQKRLSFENCGCWTTDNDRQLAILTVNHALYGLPDELQTYHMRPSLFQTEYLSLPFQMPAVNLKIYTK